MSFLSESDLSVLKCMLHRCNHKGERCLPVCPVRTNDVSQDVLDNVPYGSPVSGQKFLLKEENPTVLMNMYRDRFFLVHYCLPLLTFPVTSPSLFPPPGHSRLPRV